MRESQQLWKGGIIQQLWDSEARRCQVARLKEATWRTIENWSNGITTAATPTKYGSRDPKTCPSIQAPAKEVLSAALATKYSACNMEKEIGGNTLYLFEDLKVEELAYRSGNWLAYIALERRREAFTHPALDQLREARLTYGLSHYAGFREQSGMPVF